MSLVVYANQDGGGAKDPGEGMSAQTELPWERLALEMATMIGLSVAIAGAVARRGEAEPGRITSGTLLGAYALSWIVPDDYRPWADPLDQRWTTGAKWWWAALILVWVSTLIVNWDSQVRESPFYRGPSINVWLVHDWAPHS